MQLQEYNGWRIAASDPIHTQEERIKAGKLLVNDFIVSRHNSFTKESSSGDTSYMLSNHCHPSDMTWIRILYVNDKD